MTAGMYRLQSALRATLAASGSSSSCRAAVAQGCLKRRLAGRQRSVATEQNSACFRKATFFLQIVERCAATHLCNFVFHSCGYYTRQHQFLIGLSPYRQFTLYSCFATKSGSFCCSCARSVAPPVVATRNHKTVAKSMSAARY